MAKTNQERIEDLERRCNQLIAQTDLLSKHIDGIQAILKNILDTNQEQIKTLEETVAHILDKLDPAPKYKPTLGDFIEVSCDGSVVDFGLVVRFDNYGVTIGRFNTSFQWKTKKIFYEDNYELELRVPAGNDYIQTLVNYDS